MADLNPVRRPLVTILFASRWLMALFYLGLVAAFVALLVAFAHELIAHAPDIWRMSESGVIVWVLALIDLSLVGNLLMIVILSGYKNFVGRMDVSTHPDWPRWIETIDFSDTKLKLISSIVAISSIHLLEIFVTPSKLDLGNIMWLLAIQATILVSGLLLALTDYISERAKQLVRAREKI